MVLLATFFAQLPLAVVMQFHHPDERYYTDAALLMTESGDYLTPRFYDGTLRPHKPLLAYWLLAGSFRLFGVSLLSARLPSLMAGGLLLLLTYALGRAVASRRETALLAVCLTATQFTFVLCSNRATPDIFQTTALALGFLGLFRALQRERAGLRELLAILAGAGFAFLAKGLLGIVFLLFAAACLRHLNRKSRPWHLWAFVAWMVLVVAGYFVFMASEHDLHFVGGFIYDQIVGRFLKDTWWHKPLNIVGYLMLIPMLFIAWWPLLWRAEIRSRLLSLAQPPRRRWVLAAVRWTLVCAAIFGMGNKLTARYVLSTVPLLAVLLAEAIAKPADSGMAADSRRRLPPGMTAALAGVLLLALTTIPLTGGPAPTQALPAAALAATLALAVAVARLAPYGMAAPAGWSLLSLATLPMAALTMHVSFNHGIEQQLSKVYDRLQAQAELRGPVICTVHPATLSRARLVAGQALPIVPSRDFGTNAIPGSIRVRLVSELDTSTRPDAEFVTVSDVTLPVGSSGEIKKAWRAHQLPTWRWVPSILRDGLPAVKFRVEIRKDVGAGGG